MRTCRRSIRSAPTSTGYWCFIGTTSGEEPAGCDAASGKDHVEVVPTISLSRLIHVLSLAAEDLRNGV